MHNTNSHSLASTFYTGHVFTEKFESATQFLDLFTTFALALTHLGLLSRLHSVYLLCHRC